MRCKHQNGTLYEHLTVAHVRDVAGGIMDEVGENIVGEIDGYTYECTDCGMSVDFVPPARRKWLRKIYEQIGTKWTKQTD